MASLGLTLYEIRRLSEARELQERALQGRLPVLGQVHPDTQENARELEETVRKLEEEQTENSTEIKDRRRRKSEDSEFRRCSRYLRKQKQQRRKRQRGNSDKESTERKDKSVPRKDEGEKNMTGAPATDSATDSEPVK
ncbi:hypothetical protein C8R44DRAFT_745970 [Mycena epipterygia]|nr:hypothetical protein C8R44DRAFT_745970 [Mycena epipterygia]